MVELAHFSVMKEEVLDYLRAESGGVILDCTLGGGGHSEAILMASSKSQIVALDRDGESLRRAEKRLEKFMGRMRLIKAPFSNARELFREEKFNGVLLDLGTSIYQLKGRRGFSFLDDGPLDMRMDRETSFSADDIVNNYSCSQLFRVFRRGGAGKTARSVANSIVKGRPFQSTKKLADFIERHLPGEESRKLRGKGIHPATVYLQAIRIEVNGEFEELSAFLTSAPKLVVRGGRVCIISFHSLEDKLVARAMREWQGYNPPANVVGGIGAKSLGKLLTREPVRAQREELSLNPASRSARLRAFEFMT